MQATNLETKNETEAWREVKKQHNETQARMMLDVLNGALVLDREGISRLFYYSVMADIRVAEGPVEMHFTGDMQHAVLPVIGILNGLVRVVSDHRFVPTMRNSYLIERFDMEYCGDQHVRDD